MRMWNAPPEVLCRKHLLGEHVEMHMFDGTLRAGNSIDGYVSKGLVEVDNIRVRHDQLAAEMLRRGYRHKSPLTSYHSGPGEVDAAANLIELARRCSDCRRLQEESK